MTALLRRAFEEAEKLPDEDQDAIASRLLEEVEDERKWNASFAATTDEQWGRLLAEVRLDIAEGRVTPLDEFLQSEGAGA